MGAMLVLSISRMFFRIPLLESLYCAAGAVMAGFWLVHDV